MSIRCPKCSYIRQPDDTAPDYECPRCGIVYAKYLKKPDTSSGPVAKAVAEEKSGPDSAAGVEMPSGKRSPGSAVKVGIGVLAACFIAVLGIYLLSSFSDKGSEDTSDLSEARNFAYDIRGHYEGTGTLELERDGIFRFYLVFTIGPDYRVQSATWTHVKGPSIDSAVTWELPGTVRYTKNARRLRNDSWQEASTTTLELEDNFLSISDEAADPNLSIQKFDLSFAYTPPVTAGATVQGGVFKKDQKSGCLSTTIVAFVPPIGQVSVSKEDLDIQVSNLFSNYLIDELTKEIRKDPKTAVDFLVGDILKYEIDHGVFKINVTNVPFVCNVEMIDPYAMRTKTNSRLEEKDSTSYRLSGEGVRWRLDIRLCENGEKYALNYDVRAQQSVDEGGTVRKYIRYDVEKVD